MLRERARGSRPRGSCYAVTYTDLLLIYRRRKRNKAAYYHMLGSALAHYCADTLQCVPRTCPNRRLVEQCLVCGRESILRAMLLALPMKTYV